MKNENFGKVGEDIVTGFKGIITAFAQYITGCDQYLVQPKTEDDTKKAEAHWFDINRLKISGHVKIEIKTDVDQGPDIEAPKC